MRAEITSFLDQKEAEMLTLLKSLVLQPSFSRNKGGVDAVGRILADSLRGSGMSLDVIRQEETGDHLLFRSPGYRKDLPAILLFGHMDTVFPTESSFNWYKDSGDKVHGPGVIDMKGGLVCAVYAIKALSACGLLEKIPLTLLCNGDEEIGSPTSSAIITGEAKQSILAFGFECGGLSGEVVTGRKGRLGYTLAVKGVAGHAAFSGADKASAILELAHKTIALEKLNDQTRGIVVNVGTVHGGIGPNTVAELATAEIDSRFLTVTDAAETAERISAISHRNTVAGTTAELKKTGERLPMEQSSQNLRLFQIIQNEALHLQQRCIAEHRSGVSDANTIAQMGIPVVDGLGPIGACDHSDREYMMRSSLLSRTKLAACSIVAGWLQLTAGSDRPAISFD